VEETGGPGENHQPVASHWLNYHLQGKYDSQEMNITIILAKYLDKEEHILPPPR
jgi:hypothetical protein